MKTGIRMKASIASKADLDRASKPRSLNGNKFSNGRVLVVGGSDRFHGAPVLAASAAYGTLAALRTGAGYAVLCVPKGIVSTIRAISPNLIVVPLSGGTIGAKDVKPLSGEADKADVIVIGPGLGRSAGSLGAAGALAKHCIKQGKKLILDADALRIGMGNIKLGKNVLLTPNDPEFLAIGGGKHDTNDLAERMKATVAIAKTLDAVVLLKGHETVVSDGARTKVVRARTAALATMGTGDILSGIAAGFAARGNDMFDAAVAGAYAHAAIGDRLYGLKGYHLLASDLVEQIPSVLKQFDRTTY